MYGLQYEYLAFVLPLFILLVFASIKGLWNCGTKEIYMAGRK